MAGNSDPIYSRRGAITRAVLLKTASADYFGTSEFNKEVFSSDPTNGSYIQKLRFKAVGTNVATVARVFLNNGGPNQNFGTGPAVNVPTPSAAGGTLLSGTYYAQVIAIDATGQQSTVGALSAGVVVTGPTGSIPWTWAAVAGAVSYRIYVTNNATAGNAVRYFTSATASYTMTTPPASGTFDDPLIGNTKLYGEVALPAMTAAPAAATVDIDYQMNIALPPGWEVYVGLGTTVAAGWVVTAIAGDY
jgi:hypothetical protein